MPASGSTGISFLIVCNLVSSFKANQVNNSGELFIDNEKCLRWIIFYQEILEEKHDFRVDALILLNSLERKKRTISENEKKCLLKSTSTVV